MSYAAILWLIFNIVSTMILAFYSMIEMASVSFNKVRLQYYVSRGYKRALWLNELLQQPSKLFGTTLIGVNIALVIGSECSREFYSSIGLSPDLAPLTQVAFVVIFGELAPMFAARRYPEHVVLLGIPLLYASSKLMTPLLVIINWISKAATYFLGGANQEGSIYLSQEELQQIVGERGEGGSKADVDDLASIPTNIFTLRTKEAHQVMDPLDPSIALPSNATVSQMIASLAHQEDDFVLVYHRELSNIIGILYPRDVLRVAETKKIREYCSPPWFVTESTSLIQILKQFRSNNEHVAIIINSQGKATGYITLDALIEELLGKEAYKRRQHYGQSHLKRVLLVEKTFPGTMTVEEFHEQYGVQLDQDPTATLSEVISNLLGRHPDKGDSVMIPPFELTVKETSLRDVKAVSISTLTR